MASGLKGIRTIEDVCLILKCAHRQGFHTDKPEGARYITFSETLVDEMVEALNKSSAELRAMIDTVWEND